MKILMSVTSLLVTLLTLEMAIIIHEYGHYTEYKKRNIEVEEFLIGYGPQLFSFQINDLTVKIKLFIIGGILFISEENQIVFEKQTTMWEKTNIYFGAIRNNLIAAYVASLLLQMFTALKKKNPLKTTRRKIIKKPLKLMALSAFLVWKSIFWRKKDFYDKRLRFVPTKVSSPRPVQKFILWNYCFAFFNLIPLIPLDGGRFLIYILPHITEFTTQTIEHIENVLAVIFVAVFIRSLLGARLMIKIGKEKKQKQNP